MNNELKQRALWSIARVSAQCVEQANQIRQENINVDQRLENLLLILDHVIRQISELQDTSDMAIGHALLSYHHLIERI